MAKVKKAYFCKECGYEAPKWMGRCPACGEWNTFTEEIVARESGSVPAAITSALPRSTPQRVGEIRSNDRPRLDLGNAEVNRVLGGGLVPGSLVLLGGEPGIGKSTLSLQIALADNGLKALYVSGEESAEQIKMRADRIGIGNDACMVYSETLLENIMAQLEEQRPDLVIIDSIQTIYTDLVESSAGCRRSANAPPRCSNTPRDRAPRSSSSATSPRRAPSPARRFWNTSSTWCCSSRATTIRFTASCAASRTVSARRSRSASSRCSTPACGRWATPPKSCSRTTTHR